MSRLRLRPWTVKRSAAIKFNADVHRRLPRIQGAMWCVSVRKENEIVGIALVGHPSQEQTTDEYDHLRVLRVAVMEGHKNLFDALRGRVARSPCDGRDEHGHVHASRRAWNQSARRGVDRRRSDDGRRVFAQGPPAQAPG
jgi:hypothetical protein